MWNILRKREKEEEEKEKEKRESKGQWKKEWRKFMFQDIYDEICFSSMMVMDPPVIIIMTYYLTDVMLSIFWTYVLMDIAIYLWWQSAAEKRMLERRIRELEGDRTEIIRQKIAELRAIERRVAQREKEQVIEEDRRKQEKLRKRLAFFNWFRLPS